MVLDHFKSTRPQATFSIAVAIVFVLGVVELFRRLPAGVPLVRAATRACLVVAASAAVTAAVGPSIWTGYAVLVAAACGLAGALTPAPPEELMSTLFGVAGIGGGVAVIGLGIAIARGGDLLGGVAVIGGGVAVIGIGIAIARGGDLLLGVAVIGVGVAAIGVGIANIHRDQRAATWLKKLISARQDGASTAGTEEEGSAASQDQGRSGA